MWTEGLLLALAVALRAVPAVAADPADPQDRAPAAPAAPAVQAVQGTVSLRWSGLSERDGAAAERQDLRARLRLRAALPASAQLHLEGWARQGLHGHTVEGRRAWDDRRQVGRLSVAWTGARSTFEVGRHRPGLHTVSALETDGASWAHRSDRWRLAATAGAPVPYWEPDAAVAGDGLQAGAEAGFHGAGWDLGAGLLREAGMAGTDRWRLAGQVRSPRAGGLTATARLEADPAAGRLLYGRGTVTWRGGPWRLQAHGAEREVTPFPVTGDGLAGGAADTLSPAAGLRYGGRSHELGLRLQRRWGRRLTAALRLRSHTGARDYRHEELWLRWQGAFLARGAMTLALSDSWSPWRRIERARLDWSWSGWRRWRLSAGATATAFDWQTSRQPEWRLRLRPRLVLGWRRAGWSAELELEEQMDEFGHLRTDAAAAVTWRL